ncbi:uncharacterized protein [Leptinotarsa decemlineata]|uniref:uncharacterized protein n=1 Tax=Leptinotarsa decemlineata TaxID=7539 RepID=UPI003D30928A
MLRSNILILLQLLGIQSYSVSDYYWRDYDGKIPPDAIPADNNNNTYIGQVYVHLYGLRVGTIIPGYREVEYSCYGVGKTDTMIKILCATESSKYVWLRTTANTFLKDTCGKSPIVSGYDRVCCGSGILNIGRTRQQGRSIIGNVAAYNTVTLWFYYPLNGREIRDPPNTEYEVLVYRNTTSKSNYLNEYKNFDLLG